MLNEQTKITFKINEAVCSKFVRWFLTRSVYFFKLKGRKVLKAQTNCPTMVSNWTQSFRMHHMFSPYKILSLIESLLMFWEMYTHNNFFFIPIKKCNLTAHCSILSSHFKRNIVYFICGEEPDKNMRKSVKAPTQNISSYSTSRFKRLFLALLKWS